VASRQVAVAPRRRPRPPPPRHDLRVVRDIEGPRVRLGIAWFGAVVAAVSLGRVALAVLLGGAAALAVAQLVALRGEREGPLLDGQSWLASPIRLPAALATMGLTLAAASGTATLLAALAFMPIVVIAFRLFVPGVGGALEEVGFGLAAAGALGLAAAAPVLVHGLGAGVAVVLVLLVSAYDAGDFVVGTGPAGSWEGPAAGMAAVLVLTFAVTIAPPAPLDAGDVWVLGVLVCLLAPIGPLAASVLIGDGRTPAGFVRRLDSLVVLGPLWAFAAAALA
jgi:hypothetical protein